MPEYPQPGSQQATATSAVADDVDKALDPDSVTVSRIVTGIWMMILAVPLMAMATAMLILGLPDGEAWILLGAAALAYAALVAWSLYWPGVRYRHASYRVAERGLWIRRGVLWRSEISVPRSRVQHTDVSQGPLQRRFDLATLVLHTAGTQHAAVSLGGLPHHAALAIRDYLIEDGASDVA